MTSEERRELLEDCYVKARRLAQYTLPVPRDTALGQTAQSLKTAVNRLMRYDRDARARERSFGEAVLEQVE